jgi:hypothetical protein
MTGRHKVRVRGSSLLGRGRQFWLFPGRVAKDRHAAKDGTDAERLWKFAVDGDVDRAIGKQFRERRVPRPP